MTPSAEPEPPRPRPSGATDQAKSRRGRRRVGPRGACRECGQSKLTRGLELTAPVTTLLGLADHPGELGSWGPVIAETTRALVADLINAPWRISLTDDGGRVVWNGPVRARPDPGERRRFATTAQAAYVRARDRRCRFPGCRRPATRAELDHTIPHGHQGPTHECNLCCLCVRHHVVKTAGLWKPRTTPQRPHHLALTTGPRLRHRPRARRRTRLTRAVLATVRAAAAPVCCPHAALAGADRSGSSRSSSRSSSCRWSSARPSTR